LRHIKLFQDHGPDSLSEWQRVQALPVAQCPHKLLFIYDKSNMYKKHMCPLIFRPDGTRDPVYVNDPWGQGLHPTNVRYDPAVYAVSSAEVARDTTCIAMTRSIGTTICTMLWRDGWESDYTISQHRCTRWRV
jgi:hypothetical protein